MTTVLVSFGIGCVCGALLTKAGPWAWDKFTGLFK